MPLHSNIADAGTRRSDLAFVALRLAVGGVLIWGALTKLPGGGRFGELAEVWSAAGVPQPQLLVGTSITLQLVLALLLLVGLFTRAAGLLNGVNFAAAAAISGIFTAGSNWWPFALLIVLLVHLAMVGPGSLSIDAYRLRRRAPAPAPAASSIEELMASIGIEPQSGDGNYPGQSGG